MTLVFSKFIKTANLYAYVHGIQIQLLFNFFISNAHKTNDLINNDKESITKYFDANQFKTNISKCSVIYFPSHACYFEQ